ncbi:PREDICTED: uncharacterized protein LOC105459944 [Wasmannia auropunctata]|uniref:uncharacterized protein LOC105459944 n=1 Tax=Wasmannia auropunctata TaxID=64793 RepID=UPI0005EFD3AE|nr:PREDICTED: uncharacterized protein LOC105459944 [Wasmannia auropunctata]
MFRIASYRIEKAMAVKTLNSISLKNESIMYREIIRAVDIHRKALKYTACVLAGFEQSRFIIIIIGVITTSINLYGISEITSLGDSNQDFAMHCIIIGIIFVYLFLLNYAGQEFTDHNDHIFSTVYNVQWYLAPAHVQKVILFLLQRGSKTTTLNFGVLFTLSLEFFATLTKASISYFTVVCSMQ